MPRQSATSTRARAATSAALTSGDTGALTLPPLYRRVELNAVIDATAVSRYLNGGYVAALDKLVEGARANADVCGGLGPEQSLGLDVRAWHS